MAGKFKMYHYEKFSPETLFHYPPLSATSIVIFSNMSYDSTILSLVPPVARRSTRFQLVALVWLVQS